MTTTCRCDNNRPAPATLHLYQVLCCLVPGQVVMGRLSSRCIGENRVAMRYGRRGEKERSLNTARRHDGALYFISHTVLKNVRETHTSSLHGLENVLGWLCQRPVQALIGSTSQDRIKRYGGRLFLRGLAASVPHRAVMDWRESVRIEGILWARASPSELPSPISSKRSPQTGISRRPCASTPIRPSIDARLSVAGQCPPR